MEFGFILTVVVAIIIIVTLSRIVRIVPQNEAFIVQRLGKYSHTMEAGIHLLVPFIDRVAL